MGKERGRGGVHVEIRNSSRGERRYYRERVERKRKSCTSSVRSVSSGGVADVAWAKRESSSWWIMVNLSFSHELSRNCVIQLSESVYEGCKQPVGGRRRML